MWRHDKGVEEDVVIRKTLRPQPTTKIGFVWLWCWLVVMLPSSHPLHCSGQRTTRRQSGAEQQTNFNEPWCTLKKPQKWILNFFCVPKILRMFSWTECFAWCAHQINSILSRDASLRQVLTKEIDRPTIPETEDSIVRHHLQLLILWPVGGRNRWATLLPLQWMGDEFGRMMDVVYFPYTRSHGHPHLAIRRARYSGVNDNNGRDGSGSRVLPWTSITVPRSTWSKSGMIYVWYSIGAYTNRESLSGYLSASHRMQFNLPQNLLLYNCFQKWRRRRTIKALCKTFRVWPKFILVHW